MDDGDAQDAMALVSVKGNPHGCKTIAIDVVLVGIQHELLDFRPGAAQELSRHHSTSSPSYLIQLTPALQDSGRNAAASWSQEIGISASETA